MRRTLLVDAVGSCIAIDVTALDEGDEAAVHAAWIDALADPGTEPVDTVTPRGPDRASMLSGLSQAVTLAAIEAGRGRAWMLHAAGIATTEGQVVVLVGPSGRGKTTAARALGGVYGYVSDETIAIDDSGRVWPYRKPLSVIEDPAAPKTQRAPSALGLQPLPNAELRVAAVVLLDRSPEHPEVPVVEVADLGDALEGLVSQTSFLHDHPTALRFIAALADATGGIRTVKYREAASLPSVIPGLVRPSRLIELPPRPEHIRPDTDPADSLPRFSRVDVADEVAVTDPDRVAILTISEQRRGHVTLLGGIAPAVWRAADGATLRQLRDAAVSTYGEPDGIDAGTAVLLGVGMLLDAGLLTSDEPLLCRRKGVVWVDSGDRIAALIWEWLEEPVTLTQLIARATEAAGRDAAAEVAGEVEAFIARLAASRLVEEKVVDPDSPAAVAH